MFVRPSIGTDVKMAKVICECKTEIGKALCDSVTVAVRTVK